MTTLEIIQKLAEVIELLKTTKIAPENKREPIHVGVGDVIRYDGAEHSGEIPPKDTVGIVVNVKDCGLPVQFKYVDKKGEQKHYWCEHQNCKIVLYAKNIPNPPFSIGDIVCYNGTNSGGFKNPPIDSMGVVMDVVADTIKVEFAEGVCQPNPYSCSVVNCKLVMKNCLGCFESVNSKYRQ